MKPWDGFAYGVVPVRMAEGKDRFPPHSASAAVWEPTAAGDTLRSLKLGIGSVANQDGNWMVPPEQLVTTTCEPEVVRVEPHERLVVLARTLDTKSTDSMEALEQAATEWRQFGNTCLGRSLYRHSSTFRAFSG